MTVSLTCLKHILQVRHGPGFYDCSLKMEHGRDGDEDVAVVHLSVDDQGLAAGQFAAFYEGRRCIGSGVILESWDDQGFPVCEKALEIARMEDKSKLGKPVKIKVKPETLTDDSDDDKHRGSAGLLANCQNGVAEKTTRGSREVAGPSMNWMQKLRSKWQQLL